MKIVRHHSVFPSVLDDVTPVDDPIYILGISKDDCFIYTDGAWSQDNEWGTWTEWRGETVARPLPPLEINKKAKWQNLWATRRAQIVEAAIILAIIATAACFVSAVIFGVVQIVRHWHPFN